MKYVEIYTDGKAPKALRVNVPTASPLSGQPAGDDKQAPPTEVL